ncbi:hypothetical protein ACNOYE_15965 [Nannocystaceae bacterium ST9]
MSSRFATTALVLVLVPSTGCPFPFFTDGDEGSGGPPCEDDVLGCEGNLDEFQLDPSCTLEGELELVLGQGETSFEAIAPGMVPNVNYGFQGGQHIWAALQVHNGATDYPQLKIDITVSTCSAGDCSSPSAWTIDNTRELVADQDTMTITDEGWFEQLRMLVTVDAYGSGSRGRVEMLVTDPCGRQGYVVAEGTPVG